MPATNSSYAFLPSPCIPHALLKDKAYNLVVHFIRGGFVDIVIICRIRRNFKLQPGSTTDERYSSHGVSCGISTPLLFGTSFRILMGQVGIGV